MAVSDALARRLAPRAGKMCLARPPVIALVPASMLGFAVSDALIKSVAQRYSTVEILFFAFAFSLLPTLALLRSAGGVRLLRTRRPLQHGLRALSGLAAMACLFWSFGRMPLIDALAIHFTAPLILTGLSRLFLGEAVPLRRWLGVLLGFAASSS
jgi:drug/metabolite transporter (DMT)-like permease